MILVLRPGASPRDVDDLESRLRDLGTQTRAIRGTERSIVAVIGAITFDPRVFQSHPAVAEVLRVSKPYKLAARESGLAPWIKAPRFVVMAGPCAIESRDQLLATARELAAMGVTVLRGGAYKPRTSPYAFQGLGEDGLRILAEARAETGMQVVTEVMTADKVELVARYADILQIGARNMQNFDLLRAVAEVDKPVLLKRGLSATIDEWLMSAEYVLQRNQKLILCERGIRTFETKTRNTLDLNAVPVLRSLTHLPVVVDPSHGTGVREYVLPMSLAALAAGADGLIIEVHTDPDRALSDGPQSLTPRELERLLKAVQTMAPVVGRELELSHKRLRPVATDGARTRAAYQGEPGAFSEQAAIAYLGDGVEARGYPTFRDVFDKVAAGEADVGVLPIENSIMGPIHANYDLLMEHELAIVGELKLRVSHALVAHPGVALAEVRRIHAHPAAAAQCERFLRGRSVEAAYDTAGAVKMIRERGLRDAAAVASTRAAAVYGMSVIEEAIEDDPQNYTRFIIVSRTTRARGPRLRDDASAGQAKTSIAFATRNEPGTLARTLALFAERGINLAKIESRPIVGRPWEYLFHVDFEGAADAPLLDELRKRTQTLRVFGCYPPA